MKLNLLNVGQNAKTKKSDNGGEYITGILYLAPFTSGGHKNVCPAASKGCVASCLNTAGRGAFRNVQSARVRKTKLLFEDFSTFKSQLLSDIKKLKTYADNKNLKVALRLNGTSDLLWPKFLPELFSDSEYEDIQHYNYTKVTKYMADYLNNKLPPNYYLLFSKSEDNTDACKEVLKNGGNVAVVFKDNLPKSYLGYNVFDADETDLRFLDPKQSIAGLVAKGKAKKDKTGFVV